jgi:hypothetical protein
MFFWRLAVAHTHLFPGARLRCLDDPHSAGRFAAGDRALLEFADGQVAMARITRATPGGASLAVAPYTTRGGAPIAARAWQVVPAGAAGAMRIRGRGR